MQRGRDENSRVLYAKALKIKQELVLFLMLSVSAFRTLVREKLKWQKLKLEKQTNPYHSMESKFYSTCNWNLCMIVSRKINNHFSI